MEDHNLDILLFSEMIRKQMQANNPPLIKHRRRQIIWITSDVFVGGEAVAWAMKSLTNSDVQLNENNCNTDYKNLTETQACDLFQKLMDAGLLQNVTSQEQFKNDKSFFRFSSDDSEAEKLVRSIAIGYRLFDSARSTGSNLFQPVCALGLFVSKEGLKSSQIVTWLVNSNLSTTREGAVLLCQEMVECNVLKPVDSEVQTFTDGNAFYMFAIDYKRPKLSIKNFLDNTFVPSTNVACQQGDVCSRNKHIHLRQTSDNLLSFSKLSFENSRDSNAINSEAAAYANSDQNGNTIKPTYQSLLRSDGSVSKEALFHPSSPFVRKDFSIYPDAVGYGFVIRGDGPCFVKIVDPDSPAGRVGLKAGQYIISINGTDVTGVSHTEIADLILFGPKLLKISVMHDKTKTSPSPISSSTQTRNTPPVAVRKRSHLPSAQPWIKNKDPNAYIQKRNHQIISK